MRMLGRGINQDWIRNFNKIEKLLSKQEISFIKKMEKNNNQWIAPFKDAWNLIKV